MKKILIFFKGIFRKFFGKKLILSDLVYQLKEVDTEKVFNEIEVGDIVFAAMPFSLKILEKIRKNHRARPYIIAKKDMSGVYVYGGTSKFKSYFSDNFILSSYSYNVWKDGIIKLNKMHYIPKNNIIKYLDSLSLDDVLKINDSICKRKNKKLSIIDLNFKINEHCLIRKGDKLYFVYKIINSVAKVFEVNEKPTKISVPFKNKQYYVNYEEIKEINIDDGYILVSSSFLSIYKNIEHMLNKKKKENFKKFNLYSKHKFLFDVGQIFEFGFKKLIYLYSYENVHYGLCINDLNEIKIIKFNIEIYRQKEKVDSNKLNEILEKLYSFNSKYRWLYQRINYGGVN